MAPSAGVDDGKWTSNRERANGYRHAQTHELTSYIDVARTGVLVSKPFRWKQKREGRKEEVNAAHYDRWGTTMTTRPPWSRLLGDTGLTPFQITSFLVSPFSLLPAPLALFTFTQKARFYCVCCQLVALTTSAWEVIPQIQFEGVREYHKHEFWSTTNCQHEFWN